MSRYDIPAMLTYVMNHTNQSDIFYAGHSQGTIIGFAGFSINFDLASHVKAFFALAPVARVAYIRGLLKFLSNFTPELEVPLVDVVYLVVLAYSLLLLGSV